MFRFFSQIAGLISSVVSFVVSGFQTLISVFVAIGNAARFVLGAVNVLPASVMTLVFFFVSYCVIVNLVNKGG